MAITLAEAVKYSNDDLQRGVVQTIVETNPMLRVLPFENVDGNAYAYVVEATMPAAGFYDVGDTIFEGTQTVNRGSVVLKRLYRDADVDKFILQTNSGEAANIRAEALRSASKSLSSLFSDTVFNGDTAVNAKAFDGLTKQLDGTAQELATGANGVNVFLDDATRNAFLDQLDQAIALVDGEGPDAMFVSKKFASYFRGLARRLSIYNEQRDEFGKYVQSYAGIPMIVQSAISDTQALGTSGNVCTSVYFARFGSTAEDGGLMGLTNGGIQVSEIGELETKAAFRTRLGLYGAIVNPSPKAIARVKGIKYA